MVQFSKRTLPSLNNPSGSFMQETVAPNVAFKRMEGFRIAYVEHRGPYSEIGRAFQRLLRLLSQRRLRPGGPMIAIYYDNPTKPTLAKPQSEAGVPIIGEVKPDNELRAREMPPAEVASTIYEGPPSQYAERVALLLEWIDANGFEPAGPFREIYARDLTELPPGILYVETQVPVRKRRHR